MAFKHAARRGKRQIGSDGGDGTTILVLEDLGDVSDATANTNRFLIANGVDWSSRLLQESDIVDGNLLARLQANETITGAWTFEDDISIAAAKAVNWIDLDSNLIELLVLTGTVTETSYGLNDDITSAVYVKKSNESAPDSFIQEFFKFCWNPNGTAFFGGNTSTRKIGRFDLSTPWDIGTLTNTGVPNVESGITNNPQQVPGGIAWRPDGLMFYYLANDTAELLSHTVTTPFDVTQLPVWTVSNWDNSFSTGLDRGDGLSISSDGRYAAIMGRALTTGDKTVIGYEMTTPWDITTLTQIGTPKNMRTDFQPLQAILVSDDGRRAYCLDGTQAATHFCQQWEIATPWDMSTMTYSGKTLTLNATTGATSRVSDVFWVPGRDKLYTGWYGKFATNDGFLEEYDLTQALIETGGDNTFTVGDPNVSLVLDGLDITLNGPLTLTEGFAIDFNLPNLGVITWDNDAGDPITMLEGIDVTTPASGDLLWANTQVLFLAEAADQAVTGNTDDADAYAWSVAGACKVVTAQKPFADSTSSFYGPGADADFGVISCGTDADARVGSQDFCIEFMARFETDPSVAGDTYCSKWGTAGTREWVFRSSDPVGNGPEFVYSTNGTNAIGINTATQWQPTVNQWYHVAMSRDGANIRFFIDGVQHGATDTSIGATAIFGGAADIHLFEYTGMAAGKVGNMWMSDFRLTIGEPRYTTNFTPPASQLTTGQGVPQTSDRTFYVGDPTYDLDLAGIGVTSDNLTVEGTLDVTGLATIEDVLVNDDVTIRGELEVFEGIRTSYTLNVAGEARLENDVYIEDDLYVNGDLKSNADLLVSDGINTGTAKFNHNGTDFSLTLSDTTDFNILGDHDFVKVLGGADLRLYDSTNADYVTFDHDGTNLNVVGTNTSRIDFEGLAALDLMGADLRLRSGLESGNYITIDHDGTDARIAGTGTTNLNLTGITGIDHDATAGIQDSKDVGASTNDVDILYKIAGTLTALYRWDSSANEFSWMDRDPSTNITHTLNVETGKFQATGDIEGKTVTSTDYYHLRTETATNLASVTHAVNTDAGKVAGAMVWDSTNGRPVWAAGAADGDVWVDGQGATVHTPV